jgi:hypothetical protein
MTLKARQRLMTGRLIGGGKFAMRTVEVTGCEAAMRPRCLKSHKLECTACAAEAETTILIYTASAQTLQVCMTTDAMWHDKTQCTANDTPISALLTSNGGQNHTRTQADYTALLHMSRLKGRCLMPISKLKWGTHALSPPDPNWLRIPDCTQTYLSAADIYCRPR